LALPGYSRSYSPRLDFAAQNAAFPASPPALTDFRWNDSGPGLNLGGMNSPTKIFITVFLACSTLFAQQERLHDALVLEQQGQFDAAVNAITKIIQSGQLSEVQLGRAQIMLGFAYRSQGNFIPAQNAFERAISVLKGDHAHPGDCASALENYAALYADAGELFAAAAMWQKAFRLRRQTGDHAGAARSLLNLAEVGLARKHVSEAKQYLQDASKEMNLATDLADDDRMFFIETKAWLDMTENHTTAAIAGFQSALELSSKTRGEQHWLTGWEHMLLGKAYFLSGDTGNALADMHEGLAILEHSLGRKNSKYLASQVAYSQVLDKTGAHAEAARLRAAAEQTRKDLYGTLCAGCTISVASFR
jgi:tetratricopeptide (TPR) repeat protein